jgi:hypothetical protein
MNQSGRGRPHSKTLPRTRTSVGKRRFWSAPALRRFDAAPRTTHWPAPARLSATTRFHAPNPTAQPLSSTSRRVRLPAKPSPERASLLPILHDVGLISLLLGDHRTHSPLGRIPPLARETTTRGEKCGPSSWFEVSRVQIGSRFDLGPGLPGWCGGWRLRGSGESLGRRHQRV